jgi:enoyl-CoA hydratase/carnithine racemase
MKGYPMSGIHFTVDRAGLGQLTFHKPETRNALTWESMAQFAGFVGEIIDTVNSEESPRLRALILYGDGGSFCAGGDLNDVHLHDKKSDAEWMASIMGDALDQLERLPIPSIAAIEGAAYGGGAEIALACDFRLMGTSSRMGWVQTSLGITTGWGGSQRLLRLIGYPRAVDYLMSSRVIDAEEAHRLGLAHRITEDGKVLESAKALSLELMKFDPDVLGAIKEILLAEIHGPPGSSSARERKLFPELWISKTHMQAMQAMTERHRKDI